MRRAVFFLATAALLLLVGASLGTVGVVERRAAKVREQMFTLQHDAAARERGRVDEWVRYARRLPWVDAIAAELAGGRAISQYWLREYESLAVYADAKPGASDIDPHLLMTAAHAAYRGTALDGSDPAASKRLQRVLELYGEVLKRDPHDFDAAYNFEFVARTRNTLRTRGRTSQSQARGRGAQDAAPRAPGSHAPTTSRPGKTLHGDAGAIPPGLEPQEFKVIVPSPTDEREEQKDAGAGSPRIRKG
jgi:hypothetical protein